MKRKTIQTTATEWKMNEILIAETKKNGFRLVDRSISHWTEFLTLFIITLCRYGVACVQNRLYWRKILNSPVPMPPSDSLILFLPLLISLEMYKAKMAVLIDLAGCFVGALCPMSTHISRWCSILLNSSPSHCSFSLFKLNNICLRAVDTDTPSTTAHCLFYSFHFFHDQNTEYECMEFLKDNFNIV